MSDPRSDLIDNAQPEAEQQAIAVVAQKVRKGTFVAIWRKLDGLGHDCDNTQCLAEGSVPDELYDGEWAVFAYDPCTGYKFVSSSHAASCHEELLKDFLAMLNKSMAAHPASRRLKVS